MGSKTTQIISSMANNLFTTEKYILCYDKLFNLSALVVAKYFKLTGVELCELYPVVKGLSSVDFMSFTGKQFESEKQIEDFFSNCSHYNFNDDQLDDAFNEIIRVYGRYSPQQLIAILGVDPEIKKANSANLPVDLGNMIV